MAIGKQIKRYREKLNWTLLQLSEASDVDVGTISALELRDSSRTKFLIQLANALGLTPEQLTDESHEFEPSTSHSAHLKPHQSIPISAAIENGAVATKAEHDKWTSEAIGIMLQLDAGQRQAMVSKMREFRQFLGPPRDGQALPMAG